MYTLESVAVMFPGWKKWCSDTHIHTHTYIHKSQCLSISWANGWRWMLTAQHSRNPDISDGRQAEKWSHLLSKLRVRWRQCLLCFSRPFSRSTGKTSTLTSHFIHFFPHPSINRSWFSYFQQFDLNSSACWNKAEGSACYRQHLLIWGKRNLFSHESQLALFHKDWAGKAGCVFFAGFKE